MNAEYTVNRIRGALGDHVIAFEQPSDHRVYLEIAPETVLEASSVMFEEIGARLQIATGIDTPQGIEVMYHWALDEDDCVVTLRTVVSRRAPELESIAGMCPAAEWIEREIWELLGVRFRGHPDLRHLLLDDNWPGDNYPLRRGFGEPDLAGDSENRPDKTIATEFAPTGVAGEEKSS